MRKPKWVVTVLLVLGAGVLGSCTAHDTACRQACLDSHRTCVTTSQTSQELEQCDTVLKDCERSCP